MTTDISDLSPGMQAPDFRAVAVGGEYGAGETVHLASFRGCTVVLVFYPKDDTPGCTTQACGLRDRWEKIHRPDAHFFGVSVDSVEQHTRFIEKFALPFPLISDESQEIVKAYGVWVEKSMYGKKFFGTERSTFVIRPDGRIKSIFRKVKPEEHAELLQNNLASLEP